MKSKGELYTSIIEMHQGSGQGMSGLVPAFMPNASTWMKELIEEGLIKEHDDGGTIGHPMSNRWYYPTQGYSVWNEENSMLALSFVRFYLGLVEQEAESIVENSFRDFSRNPEVLEKYMEWLKKNKTELEVMLNLSTIYSGNTEIDTETIDRIKDRADYKKNKSVYDFVETENEMISISNRLLKLYGNDLQYKESKENSLRQIKECKTILSILSTMDHRAKIQEELEKYEKSFENA